MDSAVVVASTATFQPRVSTTLNTLMGELEDFIDDSVTPR